MAPNDCRDLLGQASSSRCAREVRTRFIWPHPARIRVVHLQFAEEVLCSQRHSRTTRHGPRRGRRGGRMALPSQERVSQAAGKPARRMSQSATSVPVRLRPARQCTATRPSV